MRFSGVFQTLRALSRAICLVWLIAVPAVWAGTPVMLALPSGTYVEPLAYPQYMTQAGSSIYFSPPATGGTFVLTPGTTPGASVDCALDVVLYEAVAYVNYDGLLCMGLPPVAGAALLPPPILTPQLNLAMPAAGNNLRVVLDPGHGGKDSGARGASDAVEKTISLGVARSLKAQLEKAGIDVYLTRDDDKYLTLRERTDMANRVQADLFLSIHCNSGRRLAAKGVEVFIPGRKAADEETRRLTALENGGEAPPDEYFDGTAALLGDLALADQLQHSARTAEKIEAGLVAHLGVENRGVKQAPFWVLLGSNMPALLIEVGFITNPDESILLAAPEYQDRMAESITASLLTVQPYLIARRGRTPHAPVAESRSETAPSP